MGHSNCTAETDQGTRIKGREMELVWHEKATRTALHTGSLFLAHATETLSYFKIYLFTYVLNPYVKEGAEQCRQL